jgi:hypothetical protein
MECESKIMRGTDIWGLSEAWEELDKVHFRFCKKLMGTPNCAANGFADTELVRDSRKGKCKGQILSKVLVPYYVFGYRRLGKTIL